MSSCWTSWLMPVRAPRISTGLAWFAFLFYFPFKMRLIMLHYLHGKTTKNR